MAQTQRQQAKALWIKRYRASQKIGHLISKLDAAWSDYQKLRKVVKKSRS